MASETSGAFNIHVAGITAFAAFSSDGLSLTHVYQQNTFVKDEKHIIKLSSYLDQKGYSRPSISRYRQHLRKLQYLDENDKIMIHGYFYLRGNNLI